MTITELKEQLTRGTFVVIADTFDDVELRGKLMSIASKGTVKCAGNGRCAGDHCEKMAVFVTDPHTAAETNTDGPGGWRRNTTKVCLTHLLDEDGAPVLSSNGTAPVSPEVTEAVEAAPEKEKPAPPKKAQKASSASAAAAAGEEAEAENCKAVTWATLAKTAERGDFNAMVRLARLLKGENEELFRRLAKTQSDLISHLQGHECESA